MKIFLDCCLGQINQPIFTPKNSFFFYEDDELWMTIGKKDILLTETSLSKWLDTNLEPLICNYPELVNSVIFSKLNIWIDLSENENQITDLSLNNNHIKMIKKMSIILDIDF